jgi:hypothetical protein
VGDTPEAALARTYSLIWPYLDERQRRLLLAAGSRGLGRGGISKTARATGASRQTVHTGLAELEGRVEFAGRVRRPGGGRKRRRDLDPGLVPTLEALVDPDTRGDPESPLRWTSKSTRELAEALGAAGHPVSDDTVGRLLGEQGYTLQRTRRTLEGAQHPDRDPQFRYLNEQAKAQLAAGEPVVSVDCKKKELVGQFANGGAEGQPTGWPERVLVHDVPDPSSPARPRRSPTGSMT